MTLTNFGTSASYRYLDQALRARWQSFRTLEVDIDGFVANPIAEYEPQREAEIERLQVLNPGQTREELAAFVDEQIGVLASPGWQFHERFDERLVTEYVTVTVLAHALSEALINAVLAIGLAHNGSHDLFPLLERADFQEKWLVGPKSFSPQYSFPRGTGMHETLASLSKKRNAIVHQKIELTVGNERLLEGSKSVRSHPEDERRWIRRYFSLPYDLAAFARKALPGVPLLSLLFDRSPIEVAPQHGA